MSDLPTFSPLNLGQRGFLFCFYKQVCVCNSVIPSVICRRHRLTKGGILFIFNSVTRYVSEPYSNTDFTFELNILSFVLVEMAVDFHTVFRKEKTCRDRFWSLQNCHLDLEKTELWPGNYLMIKHRGCPSFLCSALQGNVQTMFAPIYYKKIVICTPSSYYSTVNCSFFLLSSHCYGVVAHHQSFLFLFCAALVA
uniref:Uncharacterized protein n=1 Tax=Arion vulgaris TaxID=1028688 RepID=A0A0B7BGU6_9EUPU